MSLDDTVLLGHRQVRKPVGLGFNVLLLVRLPPVGPIIQSAAEDGDDLLHSRCGDVSWAATITTEVSV